MSETAACPICNDDVSIAKVSGIYRAQTSTTDQRTETSGGGSSRGKIKPTAGNVVLHHASPFARYKTTSHSFFSATSTTSEITQSDLAKLLAPPTSPKLPRSSTSLKGWGILWLIIMLPVLLTLGAFGVVVGIVLGLVGATMLIKGLARGSVIDAGRVTATATHANALARWDQAYYCMKHDVVFIPGEQETQPALHILNLLNPSPTHVDAQDAPPILSQSSLPALEQEESAVGSNAAASASDGSASDLVAVAPRRPRVRLLLRRPPSQVREKLDESEDVLGYFRATALSGLGHHGSLGGLVLTSKRMFHFEGTHSLPSALGEISYHDISTIDFSRDQDKSEVRFAGGFGQLEVCGISEDDVVFIDDIATRSREGICFRAITAKELSNLSENQSKALGSNILAAVVIETACIIAAFLGNNWGYGILAAEIVVACSIFSGIIVYPRHGTSRAVYAAMTGIGVVMIATFVIALPKPSPSGTAVAASRANIPSVEVLPTEVATPSQVLPPSAPPVALAIPTALALPFSPTPDTAKAARDKAVIDHLGAANSFVQAKNWPAALKEYSTVLGIDPNNKDAESGRAAIQATVTAAVPTPTVKSAPNTQQTRLYIPGLAAVDVTGNLSKRGLRCGSPLVSAGLGMSWFCQGSSSLVLYDVDVEGDSPTSIATIDATVSVSQRPVDNQVSAEFLGFIATVPYDGANPSQARQWVQQTLVQVDQGVSRTTTFGGVYFQVFGAPTSRNLTISADPG